MKRRELIATALQGCGALALTLAVGALMGIWFGVALAGIAVVVYGTLLENGKV